MGKKYDENEGVWRTIGGRRVFIRKGQGLSDAMKESGKFKVRMNEKAVKGAREEDLKEQYMTSLNNVSKLEYDGEITKDDYDEAIKNINKIYSDRRKIKANEKDFNKTNNIKSERLAYVEAEDKKMLENYSKSKNMGFSDEQATKIALKEAQKTGNDYLPKATEITTQGTSNRKEVSDNIQAHILEHYDNPVDFMEEMNNMDYYPTKWRAGEEMAKGGNYLIYNEDIQKYLGTLGINPKGKKFSDDRAFQTYISLVGRESERLYTKMEKLFEQYKKEHKGSDVSLNDFRKWFK